MHLPVQLRVVQVRLLSQTTLVYLFYLVCKSLTVYINTSILDCIYFLCYHSCVPTFGPKPPNGIHYFRLNLSFLNLFDSAILASISMFFFFSLSHLYLISLSFLSFSSLYRYFSSKQKGFAIRKGLILLAFYNYYYDYYCFLPIDSPGLTLFCSASPTEKDVRFPLLLPQDTQFQLCHRLYIEVAVGITQNASNILFCYQMSFTFEFIQKIHHVSIYLYYCFIANGKSSIEI